MLKEFEHGKMSAFVFVPFNQLDIHIYVRAIDVSLVPFSCRISFWVTGNMVLELWFQKVLCWSVLVRVCTLLFAFLCTSFSQFYVSMALDMLDGKPSGGVTAF